MLLLSSREAPPLLAKRKVNAEQSAGNAPPSTLHPPRGLVGRVGDFARFKESDLVEGVGDKVNVISEVIGFPHIMKSKRRKDRAAIM